MIPISPFSRLAAWWTSDSVLDEFRRNRPSQMASELVSVAASEIGMGETAGNNHGPAITKYRGGQERGGAWCAAFVYWCILQASARLGRSEAPIRRTHGARKLFRRVVSVGVRIKPHEIQPGDIVLWARGQEGSWMGHVGIVSRVKHSPAGKVEKWWYIAGNEGRYPARVEEHRGRTKRLIGFGRLP